MKKFISAAEIGVFRNVVANINRTTNFVGLDESGIAIYDPSIKKPLLVFAGSVKLHGTFSSFCYNDISGSWQQSKGNIVTPTPETMYKFLFEDEHHLVSSDKDVVFDENPIRVIEFETNDNAGFAFFCKSREGVFVDLIKEIASKNNIDLSQNTIMLCMEWCGEGIQKKVAISTIEKSAFIFSHAKVVPFDRDIGSYWIDTNKIDSIENRIYNINNFKTYEIEVDFNSPGLSQNKIIDMTMEVDSECPVAKQLGEVGVGEGIVFSHLNDDGSRYIFKSKGESHVVKTKVKTLKRVDEAKINKAIEVAEKVSPSWRLDQMITESCNLNNGGDIDRANLSKYLKMVVADVVKEEMDIIVESGLELKDITKYISQIAKDYFFERENEGFDF